MQAKVLIGIFQASKNETKKNILQITKLSSCEEMKSLCALQIQFNCFHCQGVIRLWQVALEWLKVLDSVAERSGLKKLISILFEGVHNEDELTSRRIRQQCQVLLSFGSVDRFTFEFS